MAYVTITSTDKTISIDFGDYSGQQFPTGIVPLKRTITKNHRFYVELQSNCVESIITDNGQKLPLHFELSPFGLKVDTVNGVTPTTLEELYDLLVDIFQTAP